MRGHGPGWIMLCGALLLVVPGSGDNAWSRLAGWLTCDRTGTFELSTIRAEGDSPALRLGDRERHIPAHLHLDVAASGQATRQWQAVFADDSLLADPYGQDRVRKLGQPLVHPRLVSGTWRADLELVLE